MSKIIRISHISLSVRDLVQSARFYGEMFGLQPAPDEASGDKARRCDLVDEAGEFGIVLKQGHPSGVDPRGLDHLSFEVLSVQDVIDYYRRARHFGAQATEPRVYEGQWQTFIFDPDGYKIEVLTRESVCAPLESAPGECCEDCAAPG